MLDKIKLFLSKPKVNEYIHSSIITFITGFALVFVAVIDKINVTSLRDGTWIAIVGVAVRAGIKAVFEMYIVSLKKN
jgi:hypothetical protein